MKLKNILDDIESLDDDGVIFAREPWVLDADAIIMSSDNPESRQDLAEKGFHYFLEVFVAKEVLEVFENKQPSLEERERLLIFYAVNDAYPEWVYQ